MKIVKYWSVLLIGCALLVPGSYAEDQTKDPREGKVTYFGSGDAQSAPEFAEAWFSFSVECQASAERVRKSIEDLSGKVWQTIVSQVPTDSFSELKRTFWGNIENIQEQAGSEIQSNPPSRGENNKGEQVLLPGTVQRIEVCTGEKLALDAKVPSIFSGSQRFGVRTENMDWLEALVRKVNELKQSEARDAVKVSVSAITFGVTEAVKREMLEETLSEARNVATGPGSQFESDRDTLKYASSHYLGHKMSFPQPVFPSVGQSVQRGLAPKVYLTLPLIYTIYSEASNLVDRADSRSVGLQSEYEIEGKAVVEADFAVTDVELTSQCQVSKEKAAQALSQVNGTVVQKLRDYQGNREATETNRLLIGEADQLTEYFPYMPVVWDTTKAKFPVTRYLNVCTNEIVDAPASGNTRDLHAYWQVSQRHTVRSSDFSALLGLVEGLQHEYNVASCEQSRVLVSVSNPRGDVAEGTKQKLVIQARENATKCVIDPNGPLAGDAKAHQFTCAHLVSIRVGSAAGKDGRPEAAFKSRAAAAEHAEAAPAGENLEVAVVQKNNNERPTFVMKRTYSFMYQFTTKNYLPYLQEPQK